MGIEPTQLAWKARTLPLSYTRTLYVTHAHPYQVMLCLHAYTYKKGLLQQKNYITCKKV